MDIRRIIRTLSHPTTMKIVGLIAIIGFFFVLPTFAADTTNETIANFQKGLNDFVSLLSRGRVVLAIIAGKLMTNDFVYGAFMHMDIYLRKIRNIMKNFANFALVAIILWSIIKGVFGKESIEAGKLIKNTLIVGILIQASRFLVGAVIDISTVATTAISSFPITFINSNATFQTEINDSVEEFRKKKISVDLNTLKYETKNIENPWPSEDYLQKIMPSYNSVSGPFIFLGMGIFKFQQYLGTQTTTEVVPLTLEFAMRFLMLFLFSIGLILLLVANIMRVGLLRVFIVGSPILILISVFKKKLWGEWSWWGWFAKIFNIQSFLAVAFKPVIFVAGTALMLMVILSMRKDTKGESWASRENNLNGVSLSMSGDTTSVLQVEGLTTIEADQTDLLWPGVIKEWQNIFSMLIMLLLTLFIMRRFIKLSLTIGGWPIEETMKKLVTTAETIAKSLPVIPFKWGASVAAIGSFMERQKADVLQKGLGMSPEWRFTEAESAFKNMVNKAIFKSTGWTDQDYQSLQTDITKWWDNFIAKSKELWQQNYEWLSLTDTKWKALFDKRLDSPAGKAYFKSSDKTDPSAANTFDAFFKDGNNKTKANENRIKLHNLLWGDDEDNAVSEYAAVQKAISYDDLIKNAYYRNEEKAKK